MPKMKTHRGAAKRYRVTGSGKIRRRKAFRSHLLEKKSSRRTRRLADAGRRYGAGLPAGAGLFLEDHECRRASPSGWCSTHQLDDPVLARARRIA